MWTRGWDLFAPDAHLVYHYWQRSYRTTFWEVEGGAALKASSQARVRRLLTSQPMADGAPAIAQPVEADAIAANMDRAESRATDREVAVDSPAAFASRGGVMGSGSQSEVFGDELQTAERRATAQVPPPPTDAIWELGNVRSLRMYEAWSGVDFRAKKVSPQAERGGMPSEASFWDRFACLHAMLEATEPPVTVE